MASHSSSASCILQAGNYNNHAQTIQKKARSGNRKYAFVAVPIADVPMRAGSSRVWGAYGDTLPAVLVARNDEGKWMLPGGQVDPGETVEHAAIREFDEEIGVIAKGTSELGKRYDLRHNVHTPYQFSPAVFFVAKCKHGRSAFSMAHIANMFPNRKRDRRGNYETIDFSFAVYDKSEQRSKRIKVVNHYGKPRHGQVFRTGTINMLLEYFANAARHS